MSPSLPRTWLFVLCMLTMTGSNTVPLTFVVGTGRCGSTMLSNMLNQHPDVLSLNEFMTALISPFVAIEGAISEECWIADVDGKEFWKRLDDPDRTTEGFINAGIPFREFIYPSAGRFNTVDGIPRICHHALPMLSDDPDSLYDKLSAQVSTWPRRSTADHCRALFAVLADIKGRRVAVERSGSSLFHVPALRQQFPEARFILLHRDGPDCALSLSRHPAFRLAILRVLAARAAGIPESASPGELSAAPEEFNGLLTAPFDGQRFMSYPIPVTGFAYMWSHVTHTGVSALRELPPDEWISVRYEDLIGDPRDPLTRIAGFLGVSAPPQWLDWACDFKRPERAGSAQAQLDPAELAALRDACAPGTDAFASIEPTVSA